MLDIVKIFGYRQLIIFGIALLIASPVAYYFMELWLSDFSNRIEISPIVFIIGLGILLLTTLIITLYHTIRANNLNPAEILKDE